MSDRITEIRPITPAEWTAFCRVVDTSFGEHTKVEDIARWGEGAEYERTLAVFEDGRIVATAAAESNELTLPGPVSIPAAAVLAVAVFPTHQRRGLLRQLMARQLEDVRARGESVAILTCSESGIYERFGYGPAADEVSYSIRLEHAALTRPVEYAGSVLLVEHDEARELLPAMHEAARSRQVGAIRRDPRWWRAFFDVPEARHTGEKFRFYAVARSRSGVPEGFAVYGMKHDWSGGLGNHTLELHDLIAADDGARAALWSFLLRLSLVHTVVTANSPVDEPLRWMLADARHLRVAHHRDALWVRIVDVCAALAARRYAVPGRIVLGVHDRFRPQSSGIFEIEGSPEGAICRRTEREPDLMLHVEDLGAIYLGGVSPRTLARAGRVQERKAGSLRVATAMFATETAPWCPTRF